MALRRSRPPRKWTAAAPAASPSAKLIGVLILLGYPTAARLIRPTPRAARRQPVPPAGALLLFLAELVQHFVGPLVRAQEQVAVGGYAQVRVGLGLAALDQLAGRDQLRYRHVLLVEPRARHAGPLVVVPALLHQPKAPRLDGLGQHAEVPRIGELDPRPALGVERHALPEQPLVILQRQLTDGQVGAELQPRRDLGDVRVDVVA